MLFIVAAEPRSHDSRPAQISHNAEFVLAIDDRESPDVVSQHLGRGIMQSLVGVGNDDVS